MSYLGPIHLDVRESALARRSTKTEPWHVRETHEITLEEHTALRLVAVPAPDPRAPLANIRAPHHMLAQLLAKGEAVARVSAITGYSPTRIRTLQADPAFQELIRHYEEEEVFANASVQAQIQHVGLTAMAVLQERLEAEPESFSNKDLKDLSSGMLDRSGHGPTAKVDVRHINTAQIIESLKTALGTEQGRVISKAAIEAHYEEVTSAENTSVSR